MRFLIATLSIAAMLAWSGSAAQGQSYHVTPHSGGYSSHPQYRLEQRAYYGQITPYSQYNVYHSPYGSYVSPYQPYGPAMGYGSARYYTAPYSYYPSPVYSRGYSAWGRPYSSYAFPSRGYSSFSFSW
jgi:hypothetical protein